MRVQKGKVFVSVIRDLEQDNDPIIGFDVKDDGVSLHHQKAPTPF